MMLGGEIRGNEAIGGPTVKKDSDWGGIHEEGYDKRTGRRRGG